MDRITRKELKTDKFAVEVEHSVEYVAAHKKQAVQYGAIALAVVLIAGGIWYYRGHQHEQRQQALAQAVDVMQAMVNPQGGPALSFPTEAAKNAASEKAFKDVYEKYPGSPEAIVAATYLGAIEVDMNKLPEAEKYFQVVADSSDKNYASLGKLSLAQLYMGGGRQADGEKLLRSLIDNPTVFVSKEQATIALARALSASKPAEARKLLDPLENRTPGGRAGGDHAAWPVAGAVGECSPRFGSTSARAGDADIRSSIILTGTPSSATATASFTRAPSGAWKPRRRYSRRACRIISATG